MPHCLRRVGYLNSPFEGFGEGLIAIEEDIQNIMARRFRRKERRGGSRPFIKTKNGKIAIGVGAAALLLGSVACVFAFEGHANAWLKEQIGNVTGTADSVFWKNVDVAKGLKFKVDDTEKTAEVVGQGDFEGNYLKVPETYVKDGKTYAVNRVSFWSLSGVKEVYLPDSVTDARFYDSRELVDIDGMANLLSLSLGNLTALEEFVVPEGLIGSFNVDGCSALRKISYEKEDYSFYDENYITDCWNLTDYQFSTNKDEFFISMEGCPYVNLSSLPENFTDIEHFTAVGTFVIPEQIGKLYGGSIEGRPDKVVILNKDLSGYNAKAFKNLIDINDLYLNTETNPFLMESYYHAEVHLKGTWEYKDGKIVEIEEETSSSSEASA